MVMLACSLAFEATKQALFPGITLWQSHGVTIIVVSGVATVLSYVIARRSHDMQSRLADTIVQQQRAEADLLAAQTALEDRVRARTRELSAQNEALRVS